MIGYRKDNIKHLDKNQGKLVLPLNRRNIYDYLTYKYFIFIALSYYDEDIDAFK
jgi:hypothetical protein